ncbi:ATP synthase F1 subunit gamma [Olivibacter sp. XZL3]|uniref:ATP synthase F1 subunit gamma n=1 Tax=Olivibacter sp. XZL3 TaxID=1735116 RepID=UPI00106631D8|nr:ATP synthase F1 subunit gamma [Olivibacter sp. XZL3]
MANLKEIRNRIASVKSTQQITKAMKMVSTVKLIQATKTINQLKPYAEKMKEIVAHLSTSLKGKGSSPFMVARTPKNILLIVVTSNRGLAGAFNANVIKEANLTISGKYMEQHRKGNLKIVPIGKKGRDSYKKNGYPLIDDFVDLFTDLNFENTSKLAEFIMDGFLRAHFDRVEIVYNEFKNAAVQFLKTEQLLPLLITDSFTEPVDNDDMPYDYIMEPSKEKLFETLIPKSIKLQLHKVLADSHASEHGARMTAMDKATENAGELIKSLTLSYNRARQSAITNEIMEIVGGAEALSRG